MLFLVCCGMTCSIHRSRKSADIMPLAMMTHCISVTSVVTLCTGKPMAQATYVTLPM